MAIVTISRGTFSGGQQLADCLGRRLGYEVVSREVLAEASERYGVSESKLAAALQRSPGLLDRFLHDRRRYLAFVQAALCEHVCRNNVVYHGHAGHLLLRGVRHVLRVRLIAPLEYRMAEVNKRLWLAGDEAARHIERVDRERVRWTQFLYGASWHDPSLYDVVLSLAELGMEDACEAVAALAVRPRFQADEQSRGAMADLLLASRVRAALAADEETAPAEIDVRASDGAVRIEGKLADPVLVQAVVARAGGVEGVKSVEYGPRAMPAQGGG
ncbi:MAG: cytidylate kinase family protein [Deltaproteobacteria bacterium]|nr:cytidylate kinase family protein [Deltaproteobacteria bacterium]